LAATSSTPSASARRRFTRSTASPFPNIAFSSDSFNMVSGAVGFKVNAFQRLLLDANVLFALDHNGVRDRITPLVGFEYSF